jgi:hypothetical protein
MLHKYTFRKPSTLEEKIEWIVFYTTWGKLTAAVLIAAALYAYILIFWALFFSEVYK